MKRGWSPVGIVGGNYADDARHYSAQDCVNYLPEKADVEGGRSNGRLLGCPGMLSFATCGTLPIRGAQNIEGRYFVVAGPALYEVKTDGTTTNLGVIQGSGRVSITHNQIADGNGGTGSQVAIATGTTSYVYNTLTSTLSTITDPGFPGATIFDYMDSYIVGVEPLGRFWFESDLADATSYSQLDRQEAEAAPDNIVSLIVSHERVLVLGTRTIEAFLNTGATQGTFQREQGTVIEQGCSARFSPANLDNTCFFFGNGIVWRLQGFTPIRISTHAQEQSWAGLDWSQAFAFTWVDHGHSVYYLTFPDGHTWGYDVASGLWHRRQSFGMNRWRISTLTFWNGVWYAGDAFNGTIYKLDWNTYHDAGTALIADRITGTMHNNENRMMVNAVSLTMETGRLESGGSLSADHVVQVRWSDDGGYNWSNWRTADLWDAGRTGKPVVMRRLGITRSRVWHVRVSSPYKRDIIAAQVETTGGAG